MLGVLGAGLSSFWSLETGEGVDLVLFRGEVGLLRSRLLEIETLERLEVIVSVFGGGFWVANRV